MCVDGGLRLRGCGRDQGRSELETGPSAPAMRLALRMSDSARSIAGVVRTPTIHDAVDAVDPRHAWIGAGHGTISEELHGTCLRLGPKIGASPGWTPPMYVFPDDSPLGPECRSVSGEAATALVRLKGGPIADDAISVIEDWFEPSSPATTASLLAELDERIELYRNEGDQALLRTTLKARAMIAASADQPSDDRESPSSYKVVPAASLVGDWRSDWETDCVIVDGDLSVEGTLVLNDLGEMRCVIVLGSLSARNLDCGGYVFVRDDLVCEHLHACSLNDGILAVGGDLTVQTFLETGTYTQVAGHLSASYLGSTHNSIEVEGKVNCPGFERRSDSDYLCEWIDPALLEAHDSDSGWGCEPQLYPSDDYPERIRAGGSPMKFRL
ncbi:hypothetical protein ERT44_01425 [Stenotrophomonas sp. MA5]|nr:hypothetical protein ERT44_01425 [Stenotrophomonas sp. MA5]